MSTAQLRLLAIGFWLATLACGIAFAAMYSEYAEFRDGERLLGTVTRVVPYGRQLEVTIEYGTGGPSNDLRAYVSPSERAAFAPGTRVELRARGRTVIRASRVAEKRPSSLIAIGGVVSFLLGIYIFLAPRRAAKRRAARREPLDVIVDGVTRPRPTTQPARRARHAAARRHRVDLRASRSARRGSSSKMR